MVVTRTRLTQLSRSAEVKNLHLKYALTNSITQSLYVRERGKEESKDREKERSKEMILTNNEGDTIIKKCRS